MRILLAAINAKYIHSNLAVYSLKAYVRAEEEIQIAEYTINQQVNDILMDLYKKKPDVLCLSCYIWNRMYVQEIVHEIKKIMPQLIIWLGGPEVSYDSKRVLEELSEVTGVMKGEGEETFLELVRHYKGAPKTLADISGITFRDEAGNIVENPWRPVMDLSLVPFVYEDMEKFEHKIIYYESSRGCPFSCSYCLSSVDKSLRFRDMELVKRELQFFLDKKVPQVKFVDRTFNCKHEHAKEIWRYILEHDNGVTNFHFEVSADILDEEEFELLGEMRPGLAQLEIGVQSTNPDTIREIKRTMRFEKVSDAVRRVNESENVHQHLDLIAGLPHEDYKSFGKSFDDVYRLEPKQLQLGFLKVLKGSYMEAQKETYGLLYQSTPPYEVLRTKWLSYDDIIRLKQIEEMVEVYYNSRQFIHTIAALGEVFDSPFALYEKLAGYYEKNGLLSVSHGRAARYEILLDFIRQYLEEQCREQAWDAKHVEKYRELLTYDFYLRENAKNRPAFAKENRAEKEALQEFYRTEEEERKYLKTYDGYDKRQMRKMTHIEKFILLEEKPFYVLFDYKNRNALDHRAWTIRLETLLQNEGKQYKMDSK